MQCKIQTKQEDNDKRKTKQISYEILECEWDGRRKCDRSACICVCMCVSVCVFEREREKREKNPEFREKKKFKNRSKGTR